MIIQYRKMGKRNSMIEIMSITSKSGNKYGHIGYTFDDVYISKGEILSEKDFKNKITKIRKCEKLVFGEEGKIKVVRYRSDNK